MSYPTDPRTRAGVNKRAKTNPSTWSTDLPTIPLFPGPDVDVPGVLSPNPRPRHPRIRLTGPRTPGPAEDENETRMGARGVADTGRGRKRGRPRGSTNRGRGMAHQETPRSTSRRSTRATASSAGYSLEANEAKEVVLSVAGRRKRQDRASSAEMELVRVASGVPSPSSPGSKSASSDDATPIASTSTSNQRPGQSPDEKILQDTQTLYALRGDYICLTYLAKLKALDIDCHDIRIGALLLALYEIMQERRVFSRHQDEIRKQVQETEARMEAMGCSEEEMGLEEAHIGAESVLNGVWGYNIFGSNMEQGRVATPQEASGSVSGSRSDIQQDGVFGDELAVGVGYQDCFTALGHRALLVPLTRVNDDFANWNIQEMGRHLGETPMQILTSLFGDGDV